MNLITLTDSATGQFIYINADRISYFYEVKPSGSLSRARDSVYSHTRVGVTDASNFFKVAESASRIMEMLQHKAGVAKMW